MLVTSQNAGLISFRMPVSGQGFKVSIKAVPNPDGTYVIHNNLDK